MQQYLPLLGYQVSETVAVLQQGFAKPAIQLVPIAPLPPPHTGLSPLGGHIRFQHSLYLIRFQTFSNLERGGSFPTLESA